MHWQLGKRPAGPAEDGREVGGDAEAWFPGAGVPFHPFGEAEVVQRRAKHMRTTVLYTELQHEVTAEREAARRALRERCFRDLRISAELAARYPLCAAYGDMCKVEGMCVDTAASKAAQARARDERAAEVAEVVTVEEVAAVESGARAAGPATVGPQEVCEDVKDFKWDASPRTSREIQLPRPLTQCGMLEALRELPEGMRHTIKACLDCWQQGRLSSKDVVDTVRSFATKSEALRTLFANSGAIAPSDPWRNEFFAGEAASEQDMLQLMASASLCRH